MSIAAQLAEAIRAGEPWPLIDVTLDLDEAYALQHEVTLLRTGGDVGGIKAGVTDPNIQKLLGLDHALIASLYASTQHDDSAKLPHLDGRMIETEIALKIDDSGNPIAIAPAVEFVRLQFSRPADMSAANLVATNMGTEGYILGEFQPWDEQLRDIPIRLRKDGETTNETLASAALGEPAPAARWLRAEAIRRGFSPTHQTVFLAGACGSALPADRGSYRADYVELGSISFEIA